MTAQRSQRYEELEGAEGAAVRFRPERYSHHDLGPVDPALSLVVDDAALAPRLWDISQNGLAMLWPATAAVPPVGTTLRDLVVRFEDHEAYRGSAVVTSARARDDGWLVGASFGDGLVDVSDVLALRDVRLWQAGAGVDLSLARRPWHVAGHDRFKSLVAETRLLLEDARSDLDRLEAELPWSVLHGDDSAARTGLVAGLRDGLVAELNTLVAAFDGAMHSAPAADLPALKRLSQRHLDPLLLTAPILSRARTKPLGYPGDFEVMRHIYEQPFVGESLYARAMQLWGVSFVPSQMVRGRKDLMKAMLLHRLESARPGSRTRILSVAAGPAQEVFEALSEARDLPGEVELVLFDQDKRALSFAFSRMQQLVASRWGARVRIVYLHDSIKRLLIDPGLLRQQGVFDVVLCAGLFDYLDAQKSVILTSSLYGCLGPGGVAYVGNVVPELPTRWLLEFHLDWYCLYKSREELLAFATEGAPGASVVIEAEPTGNNLFAVLTRPG